MRSLTVLLAEQIQALFGPPQAPLEVLDMGRAGKRLVMFYTHLPEPRVRRSGHSGVKHPAKLRTCAHCGRAAGTKKYCEKCRKLKEALYQRKYQSKYRRERK